MKQFNQLMNRANGNRIKKYYNLTELMQLTGLSIRALKYRMLTVKKKYCDAPYLLNKKDREWRIHYTLVENFHPRYNLKNKTIFTHQWVSMATWNPIFNYDSDYHLQLVTEIKAQLPNNLISYTVELDKRGINHTHLISDAATEDLKQAVNTTVCKYIDSNREIRIGIKALPRWIELERYLKTGEHKIDKIVVKSFCRISRDPKKVLKIMKRYMAKGIEIISIEPLACSAVGIYIYLTLGKQ